MRISVPGRPGRRRSIMLVPVCALAVAACGSSAAAGTGTGTAPSRPGGQGLQFANCMRAHGVSNFPDPGSGGAIQLSPQSGLNPQSPAFQAAQKACGRYAPLKGGPPKMTAAERQKALAFAKCVRAHGVPNFPDPSDTPPSGTHAVIALRGMVFAFSSTFDPQSPAFQQAARACGLKLPGRLPRR